MSQRCRAALVTLLLAGFASAAAAYPPSPAAAPSSVRLLSMHLFWLDDSETPRPGPGGASFSSLDERWDLRHYDYGRSQVLRAERPGDWHAGAGAALVVVPRLGERWAHYTLTTAFDDPGGGRRYRIDSVIGTRTRGRFGTVHTLDLARVAALPRFARDEVGGLVDPQLMERSVYWEAAFELTGLRRDEIARIDALGPGLLRPPKKWLRIIDAMLQPAEIPAEAEGHNCLGIGPLRLCLDIPRLATTLRGAGSLRERSEVRLTESLWHAGEASGVVVVGRLIDYSIVTFRVRTNGKGPYPKGVFDLAPFSLTGAVGAPQRDSHRGPESPGKMLPSSGAIDRTAVARYMTLHRGDEGRPPSTFEHRPGSLSLEAILERAFSPGRE